MAEDDVKVDTSPKTDTPELPAKRPYEIVFVSDLGADGRLDKATAVDKNEFANVMQQARPELAIAIKDPIGSGDDWEFKLSFEGIKSFDPATLLTQVPGARWRLGLREKAVDRREGRIGAGDFQNAANAATQADPTMAWVGPMLGGDAGGGGAPAADASGGGSILDMVDAPDESARVRADVESLARGGG